MQQAQTEDDYWCIRNFLREVPLLNDRREHSWHVARLDIFYDDYTRSTVSVLAGTAAEHWRRGLGRAVLTEGMKRLHKMGCTRLLANAHDPPADALYGSVLGTKEDSETWLKEF